MAHIFISYRRDDSAGYVGHLREKLGDHFGHDAIFRDIDTIEPGEDFVEAIENAVGACEVLIAVIGKQWLTITDPNGQRRLDNPHDFVRLEIATALQRNIRVIPALVGGAAMPLATDLPEDIQALARRNAQEISDRSFQYDVKNLIRVIEKVLRTSRSQSSTPPSAASDQAAIDAVASLPSDAFVSDPLHPAGLKPGEKVLLSKKIRIHTPGLIGLTRWRVRLLLVTTHRLLFIPENTDLASQETVEIAIDHIDKITRTDLMSRVAIQIETKDMKKYAFCVYMPWELGGISDCDFEGTQQFLDVLKGIIPHPEGS